VAQWVWRVVLRLRSSISLGGSMKLALPAALLALVLPHPDSLSVATPTCCSASAFRENVIIGGESMGPIVQTRTTTDCCTRCQSNPACDCCKCDVVCTSTSFTHRLASQVFFLLKLLLHETESVRRALHAGTWKTGNHDCMLKNASQCHGEQAHKYRFSGSISRPCTTPPGPPNPPPGPPSPPHEGSLVVVPPADVVPINGIAEWTITIENATTPAHMAGDDHSGTTRSAWEALNVTLDLHPPPGAAPYNASHRGFLYAGSVWKVRAALRSPGRYTYTLSASWTGSSTPAHRSQGTAICSSTAAPQNHSVGLRGFLRPQFGMPPFRTAFEDGSLFTGLGIGDCLNDQLNFLTYNETDGTQFNRSFEEYVSDYSNAGFNIFRWSNGNCAWRIEESFDGNPGRPVGNIYSEKYVLLLDRVFDTFRAAGMSMWSLPFAKDSRAPLFPNMGDGDTKYHHAQREAIEKHLEFVVARWGAQTDVWSLLNEQRADTGWLTVAAEYVRSIDPYHHPITSSWNDHVNMTQIEIDSVHWYYGDTTVGTKHSAAAAATMIDSELAKGKPVFFTESGNRAHNWDFDSHTRMRIRSWVAFFKAAALMWWNTAATRNCKPCGGGNMYLGPLERSYNLVLRSFADHMTDPAVQPLEVGATLPGMNVFGLQGAVGLSGGTQVMVYLHHNASHTVNISTSVTFGSDVNLTGCTGEWLLPTDGATTPAVYSSDTDAFTSPLFNVDMALRLTCTSGPSPPPPPRPPPPPPPSPPAPTPKGGVGGTRYKHWSSVQGANYVPSYSTNDVKDIFRPGFWNAAVVDRELGYAKLLAVNSLRVFVTHGAYRGDNNTAAFLKNYQAFQQLSKSHGLTLLVTLGTGERAPFGNCSETTEFVNAIVGAEVAGVVIAYEADNEPTSYVIEFLINCTLPALNAASRNPNVDIGVGVAHVGEVSMVKNFVTTLNWHSYNGKDNGGGLHGEINEVQKYVNKFNPPKQLVLTEWLARPAQPLAAAYPVIRDSGVAAYNWALIIVDCTTHWNRPVVPADPVFQGMIWPNGTVLDDVEEGECMRNQCKTLKYVHHCCNNMNAGGAALNALWAFSGLNGSDWQTELFGSPTFKNPGPREGSMRWTNTSGASVKIGPLPTGTKRVALYLPVSPNGAEYVVELDGKQIHSGTTMSNAKKWVARTILPVVGGKMLNVAVGKNLTPMTQFSVSGVTFFANATGWEADINLLDSKEPMRLKNDDGSASTPPTPIPALPPWDATWSMARSTVAFPANFTGVYDPVLAAKFGLNMFDQSNGQLLWSAHVHHFDEAPELFDMEDFLLNQQIAQVKAINPDSKAFIYRSGQCALSYVKVFRDEMMDPSKKHLWISYQSNGSGPAGDVYSEVSPGPFCPGNNGTLPPPAGGWWPSLSEKNITCGNDWFFDFTVRAARELYTSDAVLRITDKRVDGFFYDDVSGLGTEHGALIRKTGMSPTDVATWNAARLPVYETMHTKLRNSGKFEWHMFVDADKFPVSTIGAHSNPTNTTCTSWMRRTCPRNYDNVALMMTLASPFFLHAPGARPGTVVPEPYKFYWQKQQMAAFLLIRGKHAYFGTGWAVGLVHEWSNLYDIDFGVPVDRCTEIHPGVFRRQWSKYNVTLDCNSGDSGWNATFTSLESKEPMHLKTDDSSSTSNCTQYPATGVTTGNDVGRPLKVKTVDACIQACKATAKCCIAEFDSHVGKCYLKYAGLLVARGRRPGITSLTCGKACAGPGPTPPPSPPAPPSPPSPPGPPNRFWEMSKHVGAEYTPWRAGNQFWWYRYSEYRADIQRDVHAMTTVMGFTTIRVFLHDMLWDANSTALLDHMDDFLRILDASGMQAGFVFFDDCWQHTNASVDDHCQPLDGVHNGCWFAAPQDDKRAAGVAQFQPYVGGVIKRFKHDKRVAWWEIFNEPRKKDSFSMSLRDAGFEWAVAQSPYQPIISCWDDNNDTQVVDTHEYSIPNDRSPVFSNTEKGGIVTEAGARFFQHTHDYGSPLSWIRWLNSIHHGDSTAPFAPGVMMSWEVMVGHSNTRWHWVSKHGDPEPAIPWCGFLYPDGTPVSYTEAAAIRNYTTGKNDFLYFQTGQGSQVSKGAPPQPYIIVNASGWAGWAGDSGASSGGTLYELSIWPDSITGNMTVTAGDFEITVDAVPLPFSCTITKELGCFLDQMHQRVLPVGVGESGAMTHEMCAALGAASNVTGTGVAYGVEYGEQCWAGNLSANAKKLNESECEAIPCGGNPIQACGGPYKIQAFTASCEIAPERPVKLTAALVGHTKAFDSFDVGSRLVEGAWNILRVLVEHNRVRVWLNPTFADVTGASGPPADENQPPHPPKPLIDANVTASVKRRLLSAKADGQWRIDYASVLPAGSLSPTPAPPAPPGPPPAPFSPAPSPPLTPQFPPTWDMRESTWVMACNYSGFLRPEITASFGVVDLDWSNGKEKWANEAPMDAERMLVQQAAIIKNQACPQSCPLPHGCTKRSDCPKKVWVYRNGIKALPWFASSAGFKSGGGWPTGGQAVGPDTQACTKQLASACTPAGPESAYTLYLAHGNDTMKEVQLAGFLLTRGPYGFIGHGWQGTCNGDYSLPAAFMQDYGTPFDNCSSTDNVTWTRRWTKATVTINCATLKSTIAPTVWPLSLKKELKSDDGDANRHRQTQPEKQGNANSTCTLHTNTGVTTGHDVARTAATTATECMKACEANSLCCIGEFDSKHTKCYLKSGGSLVERRPGMSSFNCTGSVAVCYHPVGPHPNPPPTPPAPSVPVMVTVDTTAQATPFPPFWKRSFGSGHARLSLRPDWQKHLTQAVSELGLQGVRYHGIFDDDMGVVVGHRKYSFAKIKESWDFQIGLGLHPIVELSFMPAVLAGCTWVDPAAADPMRPGHSATPVNPGHNVCKGTTMPYRGITMQPTDYDDWHHLVMALVEFATATYGVAEVKKWSFEVWK
jgi:hypothetical protein